ncbi:MAG TPA: hypothetical protein VK274_00560 [Pyrinomonadaceae bacterium]|nr:hypothetical protein [Pyrinomonadaceae bacterium]
MPKDNENVPFLGPIEPSEPQGFSPEQMIRCEECLRANPPTRVSCLYCVAPLPMTEAAARLRKPVLRHPEKHQLGYNNILLPPDQVTPEEMINEAAKLLKLSPENVRELMSQSVPMPVARTASREEAELVSARLRDLGVDCLTLSDEDLGLSFSENAVKRVRSMTFEDERVTIYQAGAAEVTEAAWADIVLIVPGRLFETRLEIKERTTRKTENEILDTSEFFRDETVIDFYTGSHSSTWRVSAGGFDFSCLGPEKALVSNENIARLQRLIISKAVNAQVDDSYARMRNLLELAWGTQAETQSSGWRRERPGKLSVGVATTRSNESQFTRYARLRYVLRSHR